MLYDLHTWTHGPLFMYHIAGKFGGNNVWQKWMSQDFDKKLANEYCRRGKICWAKYLWFQSHRSIHRMCSLGHKCSLFSTTKERCLNLWKNFRGTPENHENCESLAQ